MFMSLILLKFVKIAFWKSAQKNYIFWVYSHIGAIYLLYKGITKIEKKAIIKLVSFPRIVVNLSRKSLEIHWQQCSNSGKKYLPLRNWIGQSLQVFLRCFLILWTAPKTLLQYGHFTETGSFRVVFCVRLAKERSNSSFTPLISLVSWTCFESSTISLFT